MVLLKSMRDRTFLNTEEYNTLVNVLKKVLAKIYSFTPYGLYLVGVNGFGVLSPCAFTPTRVPQMV